MGKQKEGGEIEKAATSVRVAKQGKEGSCQKQRDVKTDAQVSRRNRARNEGDCAAHVGVRATSLVLALSYDNGQIDTEKWEPRQVLADCYWGLLMRITGLGFQLLRTCESHSLLLGEPLITKHLTGNSKPSLCCLEGVLEKQGGKCNAVLVLSTFSL